jgi:hypothetical protein
MAFLKSCIGIISKRGKLLAVFNLLYFSSIFVAALVAGFLFAPPLYMGGSPEIFGAFPFGDPVIAFFVIFLSNLVLSAFVVVTLPGLGFFALSAVTMAVRSVLWGLLIYPLPVWGFLATLPTLILEGEAYVFAAVAGTTLGVSWLNPSWLYREEGGLSRVDALKKAFSEFKRMYFLVILLLFVGAIVETLTIAAL